MGRTGQLKSVVQAIRRWVPAPQYLLREQRKCHGVDLIKHASGPPNCPVVEARVPVLEGEDDLVHPSLDRNDDASPKTSPYASKDGSVLPMMIAQIGNEDTARFQTRMAIAVERRRTELAWLPILVKAIHQQDIAVPRIAPHKISSILTEDLEAIILGRHQESFPDSNDFGVDFHRRDRSLGQMPIAVFRQGSSTQADDLDRSGRGIEQKEPHHQARIVEHQPVRSVDVHRTLDEGPVGKKTAYVALLEDEWSVKSALLHLIWVVTVKPVSLGMALLTIDFVEMIEKVIELDFRLFIPSWRGPRMRRAVYGAFALRTFPEPICHRRGVVHFADRAHALQQR